MVSSSSSIHITQKTTALFASVSFLLLMIGVMGCVPNPPAATVEVSRPVTPTPTPLPTPTLIAPQLPEYIRNIRPEPGSKITIQQYTSEERLEEDFWHGPAFVPDASTICLSLVLESLAVRGDTYEDLLTVTQREQLEVDGEVVTEPAYGEYLPVLSVETLNGTPITHFPAPAASCWPTKLGLGVHTVTYRFEQTNGNIHEYTWQFEIVNDMEEQTPSPTSAGLSR